MVKFLCTGQNRLHIITAHDLAREIRNDPQGPVVPRGRRPFALYSSESTPPEAIAFCRSSARRSRVADQHLDR